MANHSPPTKHTSHGDRRMVAVQGSSICPWSDRWLSGVKNGRGPMHGWIRAGMTGMYGWRLLKTSNLSRWEPQDKFWMSPLEQSMAGVLCSCSWMDPPSHNIFSSFHNPNKLKMNKEEHIRGRLPIVEKKSKPVWGLSELAMFKQGVRYSHFMVVYAVFFSGHSLTWAGSWKNATDQTLSNSVFTFYTIIQYVASPHTQRTNTYAFIYTQIVCSRVSVLRLNWCPPSVMADQLATAAEGFTTLWCRKYREQPDAPWAGRDLKVIPQIGVPEGAAGCMSL